jgi:hypothetical protein
MITQWAIKKLKAVSASHPKIKNGVVHISLTNIDAHNAQDVTIDIRQPESKNSNRKGTSVAKTPGS